MTSQSTTRIAKMKDACWSGFWVAACCLCCMVVSATAVKEFPALKHIKPSASAETQAEAVTQLIIRKISSRSSDFSVQIDPSIGPQYKDTFKLVTSGGKVSITGTSALAAAWGFYYYLSQYCDCHISWAGDQLHVPDHLPDIPGGSLTVTSNDRFRYYQNVCTVSYSFVWWDWQRWEREIDWMAMSGINFPLAFNGQEAIWQRVYLSMGLTQEEIDEDFSGPAFLAWYRMGNMHGWGGPMPQSWHTQQVALQHKILDRMRSLGIIPILPAFGGHVPDAITKHYPTASVSHLSDWGSFNKSYCCDLLLDFHDPLFKAISQKFTTEYIKEFGTDHVYNTDTFNEMTPKSNDSVYLASASKAVFDGLTAADPDAVWVMQGWLFMSSFWQAPQVKALVTAIPQGRMIILDLMSENSPIFSRFESYYGQPFIWCMLHNFGGTVAMYGAIENVNKGPFEGRAFPNSTMIGTGLTPEGINQNDVIYEFMNENSWRKEPRDLDQWVTNYGKRRYGAANKNVDAAWKLLKDSVYTASSDSNWMVDRPRITQTLTDSSLYNNTDSSFRDHSHHDIISRVPTQNMQPELDVWYNPEDLFSAWDNMLEASQDIKTPLFRYDLVDVTRQSLQVISIKFYNDLMTSFKNKTVESLLQSGEQLLELLEDVDHLLGTCDQFLLGRWIESARSQGLNDAERNLYEYNARNQITLWGPAANILDYANKQWSGLVSGYYRPRWELFIAELRIALIEGREFDANLYNQEVFHLAEEPFTFDRTPYPTVVSGDSILEAQKIHKKYRPTSQQFATFFKQLPTESRLGKPQRFKTRDVDQSRSYLHHTSLPTIMKAGKKVSKKWTRIQNSVIKMLQDV